METVKGIELNEVFTEMVQKNHKEYIRREALRKANKQVSIKETFYGIIIFLMILLAGGLAGTIEVSAKEVSYYTEECVYDKANNEFVKLSDGEAWYAPKGKAKYTDGCVYIVKFSDRGSEDFHDHWIIKVLRKANGTK